MERRYKMLKRTLKKIGGQLVYHIDDKPAECPFKAGVPAQDNFQRVQFINQGCTSQCAMFDILKSSDTIFFNPKCATYGSFEVKIEEESTTPPIQLKP